MKDIFLKLTFSTLKIYMKPKTTCYLSMLELSKIVMYEFWCDYIKPESTEKPKLLYGYRQFYCLYEN